MLQKKMIEENYQQQIQSNQSNDCLAKELDLETKLLYLFARAKVMVLLMNLRIIC